MLYSLHVVAGGLQRDGSTYSATNPVCLAYYFAGSRGEDTDAFEAALQENTRSLWWGGCASAVTLAVQGHIVCVQGYGSDAIILILTGDDIEDELSCAYIQM